MVNYDMPDVDEKYRVEERVEAPKRTSSSFVREKPVLAQIAF